MDNLFGKQIRTKTRVEKRMGYDVEVTTIIKTEYNKYIVLYSDGSMLTTFKPEIVSIEQEVNLIPNDKVLEFMKEVNSVEDMILRQLTK